MMAVYQALAILFYILRIATWVSAEGDCRDLPLGMQNPRNIASYKITASSGTAGDRARLNYLHGSWCARGHDANPYLQIDLGTPHIICAVSTQGDQQTQQWVKTFKLNYSDDGNAYYPYKEKSNAQQIFYGNVDGSGIVKQILYQGITARYLRILPMMHHGAVCMRAEIYGVQIQPASKENYALRKRATQSTTRPRDGSASWAVDGNRDPEYFHHSCSHTLNEYEPWWIVDLGRIVPVYEVVIFNRRSDEGRLRDFEIRIGDNSLAGGASNPICSTVKRTLPTSIGSSIYCSRSMLGRFLSINFLKIRAKNEKWWARPISLCEVEVHTEVYMGSAIGISNISAVPDNMILASSYYSNTRTTAEGRLFGDSSWRPLDDDPNPWLQIDLGKIYYVCAVATQGDPNSDERITKYKVKGSKDGQLWVTVKNKTSDNEMVFAGNEFNSTGVIKHILPIPLAALLVRFLPEARHTSHALRVEIYGVTKEQAPPIPAQIDEKQLDPSQGSHVDLVCRAEGGLNIKWYHNDTDITSYSIGTVKTGSILTSTLRVNYTSADDVYHRYSCDEGKMYCCSMDYICQIDYGSYRKLQSRGGILVFFGTYVVLRSPKGISNFEMGYSSSVNKGGRGR